MFAPRATLQREWVTDGRIGHPVHQGIGLMGTLSVIWWRDIPAQVVAKDARRSSKVVLHPRFQIAIDKAANRAGKRAYNDYIAEWRKTHERCGDDLEAVAQAESDRLEAEYTKHHLAELIQSGGVAGGPALRPATSETSPT